MRESLTILAVVLIVLLTAAIVGPYFVDWTAQRALIEAQLSNALGARVATSGNITLRLLPTPYIVLGQVRAASAAPGSPRLAAETARVELSAMPLLQGQLQVTEATFDRPNLRLTMDENGQIVLPQAPGAGSNALRFERIVLKGGTLILDQAGSEREWSLEDVDGTAEARTLNGPFLFDGTVHGMNGAALVEPLNLRFSTGIKENGQLKLHATSDEAGKLPQADIDGMLDFSAPGDSVTFDGNVQLASTAQLPWRVTGALHADGAALTLDKIEARIGPDTRAFTLHGKAKVTLGDAPRADVALDSGALDLDHLLAAQGEDSVAPLQAVQQMFGWFAERQSTALPLPVTVAAKFGLINLNHDALTDVTAQAALAQDRPASVALSLDGPGRTHMVLTGDLDAAAGFSGHVALNARDATHLRDWLQMPAPLPFQSADFDGDVKFAASRISAANARLVLDRPANAN